MSISTRLKSFLDENQIPYSVMTHPREAIRQSIYKEGCQTLQTADAGEKPPLYRIRAAF